jgi:hypothetical protein
MDTKKMFVALIATFIIVTLLITLTSPVQAYDVRVSGLPGSISLDKETTIVITVDLEGAQSVRIDKIEIVLVDSSNVQMAKGSFRANGTIIDDGGFIVSVEVTSGTINQGWGYDSTTGIVYSVKILLKSADFTASSGNGMKVIVDRGSEFPLLQSEKQSFGIGGETPWLLIIVVIIVVDIAIILGVWYYFKKIRK